MNFRVIVIFLFYAVARGYAIPDFDEFIVHRDNAKMGFHREIKTEVTWRVSKSSGRANSEEMCAFLLVETLPSGLYADMDQLSSLQELGLARVKSEQPVSVEAPAHLASAMTLYVFLPPLHRPASSASATSSVTVPLHLRYHLPSPHPAAWQVRVVLAVPSLYTNCSLAGASKETLPCEGQGTCWWWKVDYRGDVGAVEFWVPVGRLEHLPLVLSATLAVALTGCLLLFAATPAKSSLPGDPRNKSK